MGNEPDKKDGLKLVKAHQLNEQQLFNSIVNLTTEAMIRRVLDITELPEDIIRATLINMGSFKHIVASSTANLINDHAQKMSAVIEQSLRNMPGVEA